MDFINAIILLLNYIFVPALTYGSQLALGAIFVTLIYGILRFANFATHLTFIKSLLVRDSFAITVPSHPKSLIILKNLQ